MFFLAQAEVPVKTVLMWELSGGSMEEPKKSICFPSNLVILQEEIGMVTRSNGNTPILRGPYQ